MRAASVLAIALGLAACSGRSNPVSARDPAPLPRVTPAPTRVPPADPLAITFAEGTPERELRDFCLANSKKIESCFADDSFWNVLVTLFFAKNPTLDDGTPARRQLWIGMRKDDFAGLQREKRAAADCEISIRRARWPSAATIERVNAARGGACASFANAFGNMMFVEGAFSEAR